MGTISMVVTGTYDPYLVALSILVACFASYTALDLGGRVALTQGPMQGIWLTVAALTMGGGIWSMRSEEHTSELQSLMRISYAVFCLKKKITPIKSQTDITSTLILSSITCSAPQTNNI